MADLTHNKIKQHTGSVKLYKDATVIYIILLLVLFVRLLQLVQLVF